MATKTFNNLPQEKKKRIVCAAIKEFSRVPIDKALISNIIKDAEIPRGSFYQYFENIEDLFVYIIDESYQNVNHLFKINLEDNIDFFEAVKKTYYQVLCGFEYSGSKQFQKNLFHSLIDMNFKQTKLIKDLMNLQVKNELVLSKEFQNMPHIKEFIGMIEMANVSCLNRFIYLDMSKEDIFNEYCAYIDYIKEAAFSFLGK